MSPKSWGAEWGEDGYIRIKRTAGVARCATDVTPGDGQGCKGAPERVKVCGACGVQYDVSVPIVTSPSPSDAESDVASS